MFECSFNLFVSVFLILGGVWVAGRYILYEDVVYIHDGKKRHTWKSSKILNRSCFCSVCEIMLSSNGVFCECCGVCTDNGCIKKADAQIKCKERRLRNGDCSSKVSKHLWVHGNLPLNSECAVCEGDLDTHSEPGLYGNRCCWCQRAVHDACFPQLSADEECDFGEFKDMIVPPRSILAARTKGAIKLHLTGVIPPDVFGWKPLIVIANSKSGSNEAAEVISQLRMILHPLQVIELSSHGPTEALQWAIYTAPKRSRILVAGGDGTVDWVLNTILAMKIEPHPEVAILPLGTGNDLSRVLGWGAEGPDEFDPVDYLRKIKRAEVVQLDRWLAEINHHHYRFHLPRTHRKNIFVYNYFSVGVDALVTLNFHKARESSFYLFSSRILNKLLYLCFGTHQVVQQDCIELEKSIELYLDNVKIELPELQSVVVLNIDSWGAGVKLWEMSKEPNEIQSSSDGILEVFGVVSSFHIAQLQVGLSKPIRLGQAKSVKFKLNTTLPVQADGEPWMQSPCDISITHHGQATMLKNNQI